MVAELSSCKGPMRICHHICPVAFVKDANVPHWHAQVWALTKRMAREPSHTLAFTIPVREPLPTQYYIRCVMYPCKLVYGYVHAQALKTIL